MPDRMLEIKTPQAMPLVVTREVFDIAVEGVECWRDWRALRRSGTERTHHRMSQLCESRSPKAGHERESQLLATCEWVRG